MRVALINNITSFKATFSIRKNYFIRHPFHHAPFTINVLLEKYFCLVNWLVCLARTRMKNKS